MERKFYEQGYGRKPVPVFKGLLKEEKEINKYLELKKYLVEKERGFQVKNVENPEATMRRYNWG